MRGLRSHRPAPGGDGSGRGRSTAARRAGPADAPASGDPADGPEPGLGHGPEPRPDPGSSSSSERGHGRRHGHGSRSGSGRARGSGTCPDDADRPGHPVRTVRVLAAGGSTVAGLAGLTTIGLLVGGCSAGGTGMRDEGPAVPAPVERTMPAPSTTPAPQRTTVDPVVLLRADPRVSNRVKAALKQCGAGSYPVNTSYGDLTDASQPDLVVNVTTCKESIGIATYVYRVAAGDTASPTPGASTSTGSAAGAGTADAGTTGSTADSKAADDTGAAADAGTGGQADAGGATGSDKASSTGATPPDDPGVRPFPEGNAAGAPGADGSAAGTDAGPVFGVGGTPQKTTAKPLPGMYQNVFTAEEPAVYGTIDRGELVVTQQVYTKGDSVTYPSGEDVVTYDWAKSRFTERYRVRNTYSKSDGNDDDLGAPAPAVTAPN